MDEPIDAICCSYGEGEDGRIVGLHRRGDALAETAALATPAPMFAAIGPDRERCYVAHDHAGGEIRSFAIEDGESATLRELTRRSTGGAEPCYVSVDDAGAFAFTANYGDGSIALFPIADDGSLGERAQLIEHEGSGPNSDRQEAPHPHSIVPGPDGRFVYAPDLGTDEVRCYELDREAGRLEPAPEPTVAIGDGTGPRHLAFHPDGDLAYLDNELDSTLTVLDVDDSTGALEPRQTVDTLPEDVTGTDRAESYPADLQVHPSGQWVYLANRGHDSIAIFAIDEDGDVTPAGHESTRGKWPRDIALDPDGELLFVENRRSDEIVAFAVDQEDGTLSPTGERLAIAEPISLQFRDGS